ncbi:MAG: hypothetical protein JNK82_26635 [Myxococcaceae bacterium]|nr:hypothetical protein [Myxococcaceae bacterium]
MLNAAVLALLAANPYLDDGRARFSALEFEAAARALAVAMDQPRLTTDERREGFDLWAQSLLALGRTEEAVSVYARLLKDDVHAPQPSAAPKVIEAFARAKAQVWPKPSVSLEEEARSDVNGEVTVKVTDPWSLVRRVRRLEDGPRGLVEGPSVPVVDHRLRVTPSSQSQRLLLDALDASNGLLAHLELSVMAPAEAPAVPVAARSSPSRTPRWLPVVLGAAGVAAGVTGGVLLGLAFRSPARLERADSINGWNAAAQRNAAVGWSLAGTALALGIVAVVLVVQ